MGGIDLDKLKSLILAEERYIRESATAYFFDGWIHDRDILGLALAACERYGYEKNYTVLDNAVQQPMDENAFNVIFAQLEKTEYARLASILSQMLLWAPLEIVRKHWDRLAECDNLTADTLSVLESRIEFADYTPRGLFDALKEFCWEVREEDLEDFDWDYAQIIVEALGETGGLDPELVLKALEPRSEKDWWTPVFAMELAGALRIAEAVPRIVDYLADRDDSLINSAIRALARIGDPRAATLIEEQFFAKGTIFQISAADALGAFKHPECERVILSLRADERMDATTAARLCDSLCRQFHPAALDWARDIRAHEQEKDLNEFEEDLLVICRLHGIEAPEAAAWHAEIEERDARFAEMMRQLRAGELPGLELPEDDEEYPDEEEYLDEDDWDDEDDRDKDEDFGHAPYPGAYEPVRPYRRPTPKVGRNEPCPCGSGKKYKKCCGRE